MGNPSLQDVRHWLQLIGHGEEGEWVDLSTVKGYHRIVFCQAMAAPGWGGCCIVGLLPLLLSRCGAARTTQ